MSIEDTEIARLALSVEHHPLYRPDEVPEEKPAFPDEHDPEFIAAWREPDTFARYVPWYEATE